MERYTVLKWAGRPNVKTSFFTLISVFSVIPVTIKGLKNSLDTPKK